MNASASVSKAPIGAGSGRRWLTTALYLLIVLSVVAGFVALRWVATLPERVDDQQTVVVGPTRFAPDSDASGPT